VDDNFKKWKKFLTSKNMKDKIIIYGTDTCPFCNQARKAYGDMVIYINIAVHSDYVAGRLRRSHPGYGSG